MNEQHTHRLRFLGLLLSYLVSGDESSIERECLWMCESCNKKCDGSEREFQNESRTTGLDSGRSRIHRLSEWTTTCAACGLGTKIEVEGKKYDPRYDGLTLHDLRRSAVRNLINAGVRESRLLRLRHQPLARPLTVKVDGEKW